MKVTILGAGSWGTTVASLVARRHQATLWAREPGLADEINKRHVNPLFLDGFSLPESLHATEDLAEAAAEAQLLVVGIPSTWFREVLARAAPDIPPWVPVVSLAKGLEHPTLLRMTEIIKELLPAHPVAALTGPNLAKEILGGKAAATVIATEDPDVGQALQEVLRRGMLRVYLNHDVVGSEIGGALKNVVAIGAGMAEGLGVGDNTRAAVITRGLAELTRLGVAMGGRMETFAGLSGLGDLLATCMSPYSRNRHVGEQLGRGRKLGEILGEMSMVAEGVGTARSAVELGDRHGLEMPICRTIRAVVDGELTAAEAYARLRHVPAGHEKDSW
jgi:glycerol-3-phosphate dehydrogenase (NAD(P)+)